MCATALSLVQFLRLSNVNMVRKDDVENIPPEVFDPLYTEFYLTRARSEADYGDANINPALQDSLRFGRPNLDKIFADMKDIALTHGDKEVAVLTCGPAGLVNDVIQKSKENSGGGVTFNCHHELFEF